nr:MAG TPA: hypothetical protein [Caudoviricetes sp.]
MGQVHINIMRFGKSLEQLLPFMEMAVYGTETYRNNLKHMRLERQSLLQLIQII